jgi:hypothetical protein
MSDLDDFAVLAATWIIASNDENPLVTYRSVQLRLNLPPAYDLHGLIRLTR